jgi:chromosome segregation protein
VTAKLTGIRIAGFKSFADAVSVPVLPGLTGIVGPNGCGKSNVVEALRWVMGETSAKAMRGGEMDDVIFSGSVARPGRNLAEVSLTLAPGDTSPLPAPYEKESELQVMRRIERGAGSGFKANGREIRARDAQTLFADLVTGARSSGMVSQGRVSALVSASPVDRRHVLEEAANVSGLRARKHEAELKLRATEQNLLRVDDLRTQLEGGRDGLRKQARQAARYRNISGLVREAETEHFSLLHAAAEAALAAALRTFDHSSGEAASAAASAEAAEAAVAVAEAAVASPRQDEARLRSALERRRVEAEGMAAEAARAEAAAQAAGARLRELEADFAAAEVTAGEAATALARAASEEQALASAAAAAPLSLERANAIAVEATSALDFSEARCDAARAAHAEADSRSLRARERHERVLADLRLAETSLEGARARFEDARGRLVPIARLEEAGQEALLAEEELSAARLACSDAEATRAACSLRATSKRAEAERASRERAAAGAALDAASARLSRAKAAAMAASQAVSEAEAFLVPEPEVEMARGRVIGAEAESSRLEAACDEAEIASAAASDAAAADARRASDAAAAVKRAQAACDASSARLARLLTERDKLLRRLDQARQDVETSAATRSKLTDAEAQTALQEARAALEAAKSCQSGAEDDLRVARDEASATSAESARASAELAGLGGASSADEDGANVLDGVDIPTGLDYAVAAAFGESAFAASGGAGRNRWVSMPEVDLSAGPNGLPSLSSLSRFPSSVSRLVAQAFLANDAGEAERLHAQLLPGQLLVTPAGDLWRWDGFVGVTGTSSAASRLSLLRRREAAEVACSAAKDAAEVAALRLAAASSWADASRLRVVEATEALALREEGVRLSRAELDSADASVQGATRYAAEIELSLSRLAADLDVAQEDHASDAAALLACVKPVVEADTASRAEQAVRETERAREARRSARSTLDAARDDLSKLLLRQARAEAALAGASAKLAASEAELAASSGALKDAEAVAETLVHTDAILALAASVTEEERVASAAELAARNRRDAAEARVDITRSESSALATSGAQARDRHAALEIEVADRQAQFDAMVAEQMAAAAELAGLEDVDGLAAVAAQAASDRDVARALASKAEVDRRAAEAEAAAAPVRLAAVREDLVARRAANDGLISRLAGLRERVASARGELDALLKLPGELLERSLRSDGELRSAEALHGGAEAALVASEAALRAATAAAKEAVMASAAASVGLARAEAARDAAAAGVRSVLERAVERLGVEAVLPYVEDWSDAAVEKARKKVDRLTREREEMGPVNLRAEAEIKELEERIAGIEQERAEVATAVAKLRGAIGNLNREGRERLSAVFEQVNRNFSTLFTRTMGGGRANIALVGSDDPLEAGVEIYAEPPGKKLSSLSLLSGGEQALTALSLIFAVFMCNPAPVAVLDEVDAPLDDANVERLCGLLDSVSKDTNTRFLVVTHHQVTMSRMDRLFGVTMQERGVSKILSVDLGRATVLAAA